MSKGGDRQAETPRQRALAEYAANQWADYVKRWAPLQQRLAQQIQASGASDSVARRAAAGKANVDTQIQFGKAQGGLEKALTNSGAAPGSGRFNLAVTGMGADAAKSKGLGLTVADQMVDDAYVQGLSALAATGRGEKAMVSNSLAQQAAQSGRQAAADAEASLSEHAAQAGLVGQLAGYGLGAAMRPSAPQPAGMSPTVLGAQSDGFTTNPQFGP